MRAAKLLVTILLLMAATNMKLHAQNFQARQFWMSGIPVTWMNRQLDLPPNDYMDVFNPDAPWQKGESRVTVFKVTAQFVLFGSDAQIRTAFNAMHQRQIKMAVEMGSVVKLDACGGGEGYAPPNLAYKIGRRLQKLGLTFDIVAFDEPVGLRMKRHGAPQQVRPIAPIPCPRSPSLLASP